MLDFLSRNKVFITAIFGTLVLLFGGVFLLTKNNGSVATPTKVSSEVLAPEGSEKTSGIVNGIYQSATPSATVTLVEFGDYECPACGAYNPFVKQLLTDLNGKVNFVFRNYPLPQHANAKISSYAAEAAGLQGKFWLMHDKLYETQKDWSESTDAKTIFIGYAQSLGLDLDKFKKDIESDTVKKLVDQGTTDGNLVSLSATPTFYLNGTKIELPNSYAEFKDMVSSQMGNK